MRRISVITLCVLLAGFSAALGASPEDEVLAAEKRWAAAVIARDFPALEKILSDELIYAHSTGAIETKSEYLGKLRAGTQKYDVIEHHKSIVKTHADAAVAHSIVTMKGNSAGEPFDNKLMMIHMWVQGPGGWRLVAHQTTRLAE